MNLKAAIRKILYFTVGMDITEADKAAAPEGAFFRNGGVHRPGDTLEMADEVHGHWPVGYADVERVKKVGDGAAGAVGTAYTTNHRMPLTADGKVPHPAGTILGESVVASTVVPGAPTIVDEGTGVSTTQDENDKRVQTSEEIPAADATKTADTSDKDVQVTTGDTPTAPAPAPAPAPTKRR